MKNSFNFPFVLLLALFLSCNKDENNTSNETAPTNTVQITLSGIVSDEAGNPLAGTKIIVGNVVKYTDNHGIFTFNNVKTNSKRTVLNATKNGYWDRIHGFIPSTNGVNYCRLTLATKSFSYNVVSSSGGSVPVYGGASILFPPNAFAMEDGTPYTGTVMIAAKFLPTTDPNFETLIPGSDLLAKDLNGDEKILITYGMIGAEMQDPAGNKLQLASGKSATINLPIPITQMASAPATIPLWHFDTEKNIWIEEGQALKIGSSYEGNVSHFSWWNCDYSGEIAYVNGQVVNNSGDPLENVMVYANGRSGIMTDQFGRYSGMVPANLPISISAKLFGISSQTLGIAALSKNEIHTASPLIINFQGFGKIYGKIVDCNSSATDGILLLSNQNYTYYNNSINGVFNINFPCGNINLMAYKDLGIYTSTLTSVCAPDSTNAGTIVLCNPTGSSQNSIELDISPNATNISHLLDDGFSYVNMYSNILQINDVYNCAYDPAISIYISGIPLTNGTYQIISSSSNNVSINLKVNSKYYTISTGVNVGFTVTILNAGLPGTPMELTMSGPINITDLDQGNIVNCQLNYLHAIFIRP